MPFVEERESRVGIDHYNLRGKALRIGLGLAVVLAVAALPSVAAALRCGDGYERRSGGDHGGSGWSTHRSGSWDYSGSKSMSIQISSDGGGSYWHSTRDDPRFSMSSNGNWMNDDRKSNKKAKKKRARKLARMLKKVSLPDWVDDEKRRKIKRVDIDVEPPKRDRPTNAVPEPGAAMLFLAGLTAAAVGSRKRED